METLVWREAQWGFCNNQKLNGIVENSQNTLITSLQKDISEIEEDRTQLIRDVKIFANSTKLSNKKRRSITLLAAGAAAALVLEPIVEKTACKMLSIFHLCQDSEEKMRRIASHLDSMEYKLHHLTSDTDNTIHILGNENLKQQEQMKTILNYTAGNFGTVENAVNNLEQDMEQVQQAQVCDHKRSDVFTFFLKTQSVINKVSFALVSLHSEVQSFKYELKQFNSKVREAFQDMSNGRIPSRLVEPDKLRQILQPLRFHRKTMSIPLQHVSLYYELELLRNVFIANNGLLLKIEIPMSSQSPIHKVFKGVPLPQPITNSTIASVLVLEHELLVVSEATTNFAEVDETQILSCQGSKRLKLCEQPFPMTGNQQAGCLISLFSGHEAAVLQTCKFDVIHLPIIPTATYLAHSKFLILSAFTKYWITDIAENTLESSKLRGCQSCIVQPSCYGRIEIPNGRLILRPSTDSCQNESGLVMRVSLNPLLEEAFTLPTPETHNLNSLSATFDQKKVLEHVKVELQAKPPLEIDTGTIRKLVREFHQHSQRQSIKNAAGGTFNNVISFLGLFLWISTICTTAAFLLWKHKKLCSKQKEQSCREDNNEESGENIHPTQNTELLCRVREQNKLESSTF